MRSAQFNLNSIKEEERVLEKFEKEWQLVDLQNKYDQAGALLNVARISKKGKIAEAEAKLRAAEQNFGVEKLKLEDLEDDIRNCEMRAPNDGLVVYFMDERSRFGGGGSSQSSIVAQGEPVRERQRLMRIPDLSKMQVRVKIHEAVAPKLIGDRMRSTGFRERLGGIFAVGFPSLESLTTVLAVPQIREALMEAHGFAEEEVVEPGMPAQIKIASVERPVHGHVKLISSVASTSDWSSADVRVYPALVTIDEPIENLKPGMSAEVTILINQLADVLQLPVNAVLEAGGERFCYVKTAVGAIEKRKIITGLNNNKFVEVQSGSELQEGELVVMNPSKLA
jgi:multidrug efflux pump subunit AcrA (membrane-fusion protein)